MGRFRITIVLLCALVAGALISVVLTLVSPYWVGTITRFAATEGFTFWTSLVALAVAAALAADVAAVRSQRSRLRPSNWAAQVALTGVVGAAAVAYCLFSWMTAEYHATQQVHRLAVAPATSAPQSTFQTREAFEVAASNVKKNLGDVIAAEQPSAPAHVHDAWTSLVKRTGWNRGYLEVVVRHDDESYTRCMFNGEKGAKYAFGAKFGHSLGRKLTGAIVERFGRFSSVGWNSRDVYGYCDGDTPVVVIPLTEWKGHWASYEVPAGVAVVREDEITIRTKVAAGELPGPVYPQSLALGARNSTHAAGSYYQYAVKHRVGYDSANDLGDAGAGNSGEFVLSYANHPGGAYVTALRRAGASQSIGAVAEVAYGSVTAGHFNKLEIHTIPAESGFAPRCPTRSTRSRT